MRSRMAVGRVLDKFALSAALFLALSAVLASTTRNLLIGVGLAVPVTLLFLYALRLWRRRAAGAETLLRNARYHLQTLMLLPEAKALRLLAQWLPALDVTDILIKKDRIAASFDGKSAEILLLRRAADSRVTSDDILQCYHRAHAKHCVIVSTALFDEAARVFARLRKEPSISLIGPDELLPILRKFPAGDAPAADEKEQRRVLFSRIKERAFEPKRQKRCLIYGMAMLAAYIIFHSPFFLFPGLACIFVAVIGRHRTGGKPS